MNSFDEYQAEIAYRREQMLRGRGAFREWLRARRPERGTAPRTRRS